MTASDASRSPTIEAVPRWDPLALVGIWSLGLLAYCNSFGGAFVYDDVRQLQNNPVVHGLGAFFAGGAGLRFLPTRALTYLTFAANHSLGGLDPVGYHAVNVAIHLGCATLTYALVLRLLQTPRLRGSRLAPSAQALAFAVAALFATHPLQSQAVTYVVQRLTCLATLLYLLTTVLYLRWRLTPAPRGAVRSALLFVSSAAAMFTKEIAFTLPATLLLVEWSFFRGSVRERLRQVSPALAAWPIIPIVVLWTAGRTGAAAVLDPSRAGAQAITRLEYLASQPGVVARYLGLLFWPSGQCLDHDVPVVRAVGAELLAPLCLLVALFALAAALYWWTSDAARRRVDPAARLVGFGIGWFFLTLSVESSVLPIADLMYEHRVYLPAVGGLIPALAALALGVSGIGRLPTGRVLAGAGLALGLILCVLTVRRNTVWHDDVSLWSDSALCSPAKSRPFANLGSALVARGQTELGARALRRAVELAPTSAYVHAQLATTLLIAGRPGEAEPELREALRLDPRDVESTHNLATLLWATGRREEARSMYGRFLELAPAAYASARRVAAERAR